jgi:hypothetical protein
VVTFGTTTEGVATLHCTPLTLTYFVKVSCKVALGLGVRLIRVGHHKVCLRVRVRVSFFFPNPNPSCKSVLWGSAWP